MNKTKFKDEEYKKFLEQNAHLSYETIADKVAAKYGIYITGRDILGHFRTYGITKIKASNKRRIIK